MSGENASGPHSFQVPQLTLLDLPKAKGQTQCANYHRPRNRTRASQPAIFIDFLVQTDIRYRKLDGRNHRQRKDNIRKKAEHQPEPDIRVSISSILDLIELESFFEVALLSGAELSSVSHVDSATLFLIVSIERFSTEYCLFEMAEMSPSKRP